jgi:hypothetical protein
MIAFIDMVAAFGDEERCRRLLEAMIWPRGRLCPRCGCRDSIALAGRDVGRKARPGLSMPMRPNGPIPARHRTRVRRDAVLRAQYQ